MLLFDVDVSVNIFVLDSDPKISATNLVDVHVRKMILETAQILCTVSYWYNVVAPYKPTHQHRLCVRWPGLALGNWEWLIEHGLELGREFERRFGKKHKSADVIEWCRKNGGRPEGIGLTAFAVDIPKKWHTGDPIGSYRGYYVNTKTSLAKWTSPGVRPIWWSSYIQ